MNSKIIYVVTSSTSDVMSPRQVRSPVNSEDVSSSSAVVPNSCVTRLNFSPGEAQGPSSSYDNCALANSTFNVAAADDSNAVCETKLEQKFFPEVSTLQSTSVRMPNKDTMDPTYEALDSKEQSQPNIVLENVDHSAPEIFTIDDCGPELYVPDREKSTDGKEQRDQNYENDGSSACPIVDMSIVPHNTLWTCWYCGLTMSSSPHQIRRHMDLYCYAMRRSIPGDQHDVSRSTSPDIDVKTAVDPSQISTISFVSNCNSYGNTCDTQRSSGAGLSVSLNNLPSFNKCPVCNEEVGALGDHLSEHEKKDLVNVILKFVLPFDKNTAFDDDVCIVEESRRSASVVPSSADTETLHSIDQPTPGGHSLRLTSPTQDRTQNFPASNEMKSKCSTFTSKIKPSSGRSHPLKASQRGNFVPNRSLQSNVLGRHTVNSRKSFRQWSSRAPHPCPVCDKVLSSRGNLSKHLLLHSSAKPWNCSTCSLGFNSHRDWDYHQLQYHSLDRPHVCPVCSKSFAVLANLKEHVVFHGQKTKACDVCGKMFWTSKCVSRHKKRHYTDKKYACSLCSKEFAIKWDYSLHYKKVHGTK